MGKKDDLEFDYDERTAVPTFEEVSSVMPKFLKAPHKHRFGILFLSLFAVILLVIGGTVTYKTAGVVTPKIPLKAMTGLIINDVNYSNKEIYGIGVDGVVINLTQEEVALIKQIREEMTDICTDEKKNAVTQARVEKENACIDEIKDLKDDHEDALKTLEDEIEEWKDKYNSCKSSLSSCGS